MASEVALRKRLRMTLDLEVEVEELTDEYLRDYYRSRTDYDALVGNAAMWTDVSRQLPLQRALLEDAWALRRYLVYVATTKVNPSLAGGLGEMFGVEEGRTVEEVLGSLLWRLSLGDGAYFLKAMEGKVLFEATRALRHSFGVRWRGGVLEEVGLVEEGEAYFAESDNLM